MDADPVKICNNCGRQFMTPEDLLARTYRWRICESGHLWFNCTCSSTHVIIKGKFDWYRPQQKLGNAARSVFNQIPSIEEMPRMPTSVMELQKLLENPNTSAKKLASVAKTDPLLSNEILKIANNFTSNRSVKLDSLAHAIAFIGLKSFKEIIMIAAMNNFKINCKVFSSSTFWEQSIIVGQIAEALTKHFQLDLVSDEVFLAGSLCNVGKLVLAMCLPEQADKFASELINLSTLGPWTRAEARNGGYQHTVLGEIAAVFWGLPDYARDAISQHHQMPKESDLKEKPSIVDVVTLANQIGHWILLQPSQIDQRLFDACCRRFKLSPEAAEELVDKLMFLSKKSA